MDLANRIKFAAVLLIGAAVLLTGCANDSDPAVYAVVNGEDVTREEFHNYKNYLLFTRPDLEFSKAEEKQILEDLINLKIYLAGATSRGFQGDQEAAQKELESFRKQRLAGELFGGSLSMYYGRLLELGLNESWILEFFQGYDAINSMIEEEREKALEPTDEEIEAYYQDKKATNYTHDEQREIRHILVNDGNFPGEVADDQVKALADDLYSRLLKGEDFAKLAAEYSQDGSAEKGGDIGLIEKKDVVESFGDSAFSLKLEEISPPVHSQYGWHIIQVTEIKPAGQRALDEELKNEIAAALLYERQESMVEELLDSLTDAAEVTYYFK